MESVEELAAKVWRLSRDSLLIHLRFLDVALSELEFRAQSGIGQVLCDMSTPRAVIVFYDPQVLLRLYKTNPNNVTRLHLHILLHCIFGHSYKYNKVEQELWNIAADMAVENAALELQISGLETEHDRERREILEQWRKRAGALTADRIYRKLKEDRLKSEELLTLGSLFCRDVHDGWKPAETLEITEAQWKKISERIRAELKSFSGDKSNDKSLLQNLEEAVKETYDYGDFLRKFSVSGEEMQINDDEFDLSLIHI